MDSLVWSIPLRMLHDHDPRSRVAAAPVCAIAMYASSGVATHAARASNDVRERRALDAGLRQALADGHSERHYQPCRRPVIATGKGPGMSRLPTADTLAAFLDQDNDDPMALRDPSRSGLSLIGATMQVGARAQPALAWPADARSVSPIRIRDDRLHAKIKAG